MKNRMLAIALALLPFSALADSYPALTSYLSTEIAKGHQMMQYEEDEEQSGTDAFLFRRFLIRLQAPVGFNIPWIATFEIVPEVELYWEKPFPEGWEEYKP